MYYYEVYLPINIKGRFTYSSQEKIIKSARVIVDFNSKLYTGIIGNELLNVLENYNIKSIIEVIDDEPIIKEDLLRLALWMEKYYFVNVGVILNAMLPVALNVTTDVAVKRVSSPDNDIPPNKLKILNLLNEYDWLDLEILKEHINIPSFYKTLHMLENEKYIEIKRTFDKKIKKKIVNYVVPELLETTEKLTDKQRELFDYIKEKQTDFRLSEIADKFSYSIVKALRKKQIIRIEPREISEKNEIKIISGKEKKINLTSEQQESVDKIKLALQMEKFSSYLLFGVTGSGKTEVYIKIVEEAIHLGKTALILVPEISLAPQMVKRFYHSFKDIIAVLHSSLNDRERWQEWERICSGKAKIVIGARSAVFAPLDNLGIIIVDEEHESTYKQENMPRYNARDLAVVRAKLVNAIFVAGSATPSLESWNNALQKKYEVLYLRNRPQEIKLPQVEIVDLREAKREGLFSEVLLEKIASRISQNEQIVLLHNRRGYSSFVQCVSCGSLFKCSNCEISLSYHQYSEELVCHYCGEKISKPRKCPECGSFMFQYGAEGIEQVEKQLKVLFPEARLLRMDSDTTTKKDSYETMYEKMYHKEIDILLGTQMIAKGLDFPDVTLVGVVNADIGLNMPDFRAAEKTFQILTQVAGRAGRGEKPGEVLIQTFNPEHYAIEFAKDQNFTQFAKSEMELRKTLYYSPFYRMARIIYEFEKVEFLIGSFEKNKNIITKIRTILLKDGSILMGPNPAPFTKLRNKYRYHIIIKANDVNSLSKAINLISKNLKLSAKIKQIIDVDPANLF